MTVSPTKECTAVQKILDDLQADYADTQARLQALDGALQVARHILKWLEDLAASNTAAPPADTS